MRLSCFRRRATLFLRLRLCLFVSAVLLCLINMDGIFYFGYRVFHVVSYTTRPIWDKQTDANFTDIPFFGAKWKLTREELCKLHGWQARERPVKVYDAILFSNEMEILEVRLRELHEVVDRFIILESDHTFTGYEKPLYLSNYIGSHAGMPHAYDFASDKMEVHMIHGYKLGPTEGPFKQEGETRAKMNGYLRSAGIRDGDLLIVSDVDEIPRAEVVELFRSCTGMPKTVHLDMNVYVYSFGYKNLLTTWKASIQEYEAGKTAYSHRVKSTFRLADSGWHCSFCFATLAQFQFKMAAYSHAERASWHPKLMSREHIQRQICEGQDLYNMWPEAYTFGDLFKMASGYERLASGRDLPEWLLLNRDRYEWLLPGGNCTRA